MFIEYAVIFVVFTIVCFILKKFFACCRKILCCLFCCTCKNPPEDAKASEAKDEIELSDIKIDDDPGVKYAKIFAGKGGA